MAYISRNRGRSRFSLSGTSSMYTISDPDAPVCGFLNRKSVTDSSGKKSKDRHWQTLWCQLKESKMEFYKVSGISVKPNREPPPRDIYPPPNRQQHYLGSFDLEGSLLEIDYTSQRDKDLDKRRKYLFRLILLSKTEFLFQAPSENSLMMWATNIRRLLFMEDKESEEGDLSKQDVRIKASRCSINKKSKHNTNSVRVIGRTGTDDDDFDGSYQPTLADIDPRLLLLKKRLQAKRELAKHINKLIKSYEGNTECIYREADIINSASYNSSIQMDETDNVVGSNRNSRTSNDKKEYIVTELLEDYHLIPGVEWSVIKKGEKVQVKGRLPNGWYKCKLTRDATFELESIPASPEGVYNEENTAEGEESEGQNGVSYETNNKTNGQSENDKENDIQTDGHSHENSSDADDHTPHRFRTDSYMMATTDINSLVKTRHSYLRKDSYKVATRGHANSLLGDNSQNTKQTRHLSLVGTPVYHGDCDDMMASEEMIRIRARVLISTERHNNSYYFPLVGSIPPSVLAAFAHLAIKVKEAPPTSATPTNEEDQIGESSEYNLSSSFDLSVEATPSLDATKTTPTSDISKTEDSVNEINSSPSLTIEDTSLLPPSSPLSPLSPISPSPFPLLPSSPSPLLPSSPSPLLPSSHSPYRQVRASSTPAASLTTVEELEFSNSYHDDGHHSNSDKDDSSRTSSEVPNSPLTTHTGEGGPTDDDTFIKESVPVTPRRRASSKEMKVVPSPSNTLERSTGSGSGQLLKNSVQKQGRTKRIQSEEIVVQPKKGGLFQRIRTNIFGHNKKEVAPKQEPHPPITNKINLDIDDDLGQMRSRVTSVSGKALRSRGMEVTFGDSSSDSESEETSDHKQRRRKIHPYESITINEEKQEREEKEEEHTNTTMANSPKHLPLSNLHEPLSKVMSSPVTTSVKKLVNENVTAPMRRRIDSRSFSTRNLYDGTKMLGYIKAPPKRVKRHIYLDPSETKFGLYLENYELHIDQGKISRAIVQYVMPGSPAFVAGLYPGDQILQVNQKDVSRLPVSDIVNAIQNADPEKTLELVVAYVDGVHRLEVQSKGTEFRDQLKDRQKQLQSLISSHGKLTDFISPPFSPPLSPITPSYIDVTSWSRESLSDEEPSLHMFRYNPKFNEILTLSYDDVRLIPCDMLIIPLVNIGGKLQNILKAGGEELMDELCMAEHCSLGENIITGGYTLPVQAICHSVFGSSEDSVISCCRSALETAYEQNYKSIVFWLEGFVSARVSPGVIVSTIRGWLEEGENGKAFDQINFNILSTPAMISLIERYFPLEDYEKYRAILSLNYCTDSDDEEEQEEGKEAPPILPPKLASSRVSRPPVPPKPFKITEKLTIKKPLTDEAIAEEPCNEEPINLNGKTSTEKPSTVEENISNDKSITSNNLNSKEYNTETSTNAAGLDTELGDVLVNKKPQLKPLEGKDSFLDSLSELDTIMHEVDDTVASLTQ